MNDAPTVEKRPPLQPFFVPLNEIPGLKEAVAAERKNRLLAWFDVSQTVCGFEIMPLTARGYLALQISNSPFLRFAVPTAQELADFLWITSPEYETRGPDTAKLFRKRCENVFEPSMLKPLWWSKAKWARTESSKLERAGKLIEEIYKIIAQAFQDSPVGVGDGKSYYNGIVSLVGMVARNYGWTEERILEIPLARLFQYARECQESDSLNLAIRTKTKYRNPLSNPSDSVTAKFCEELGRKSLENAKN